jgi:hypothetical protein
MTLKIVSTQFFAFLCALMLFFASVTATPAHAAVTVNSQTISEQTEVVEEALLKTMEEYVKLLQMTLIEKLQERLALLQAQAQ